MKQRYFKYFLQSALLLIFISCGGSQSLYKKGMQLHQAGMYSEASRYYEQALIKNRDNVEAMIGLKSSSALMLEEQETSFEQSVAVNDYEQAISKYAFMEKKVKQWNSLGLQVEMPEKVRQQYATALGKHIDLQVAKAYALLEDEKFEEAEVVVKQLMKLDPKNQELADMFGYSKAEPIYRRGVKYFEEGDFRRAHKELLTVRNYENSKDLIYLSLEKGRKDVAIFPFSNHTDQRGLESRLEGRLQSHLLEIDDPFVRVLDREVLMQELKDKGIRFNSLRSPEVLDELENLTGLDLAVQGKIIEAGFRQTRPQEDRRKGYERRYYYEKDPETGKKIQKTRYEKIYYYQYHASKTVYMEVEYNLLDVSTGAVVYSNVVNKSVQDRVDWAEYEGTGKELRSGHWVSRNSDSPKDRINTSSRNEMKRLLSANRKLRSTDAMEAELLEIISLETGKNLLAKLQ